MAARSLTVLLAGLLVLAPSSLTAASDCQVVDDFSKGKVGQFPPDWKPRKDAGRSVYVVREEEGRRFLRATSRGLGIQAAKQFEWDLSAYPVLAWSWRPMEFPRGSDERKSSANDSALSVYAVFPHTSWSVKSLKYIWSAVVPVGTRVPSSQGLTQGRIIRSGTQQKGQWVEEKVNVLDDYKKSFKDEDVPKPAGLAVLTDADDTKSSAQGDYANFRACKP